MKICAGQPRKKFAAAGNQSLAMVRYSSSEKGCDSKSLLQSDTLRRHFEKTLEELRVCSMLEKSDSVVRNDVYSGKRRRTRRLSQQ